LTAAQLGGEGLANLNTINGSPVIDRGIVFAISHGGRLAALDLRTGNRMWDQALSGTNTPWLAGDFLFVVTTDGEVVCLSRERGRVRWVQPLPGFKDPAARKGPIVWSGPLLVSDRLVLVASNGDAVSLSPYDGHVLGQISLPAGVRVPPIAAGGSVYVLTEDADIVALR
jgi:outer membrane protein assembly factor BamB